MYRLASWIGALLMLGAAAAYDIDDPLADHQSYAIMMMDQQRDFKAGLASFRAAARFSPTQAAHFGNLGSALQDDKNPARADPSAWLAALQEAQAHFSTALRLNPRNGLAQRNIRRNKELREAAALAATPEKDYYAALGIGEDASEPQVKKAFRELSRRLHPDKQQRGAGERGARARAEAARRFAECREAFEVLSDASKRALYDAMGTKGVREWEKTEGQRDQWGRQAESTLRQGRALDLQIRVSLAMLYTGGEVARTVRRKRICRGCGGAGTASRASKRCHGCQRCPDAVQWQRQRTARGQIIQQQVRVRSEELCRTEHKTLTAPVEKGASTVAPHNRIVFRFAGDQEPGGLAPADVVFHLDTPPDDHQQQKQQQQPQQKQPRASLFQRRGDDLVVEQALTLKEALLGFSKRAVHLDGHTVKISSVGVTRPGTVRVVAGEGMPRAAAPGEYGKLYVRYAIKFPAAVGAESRTVLAGLADDVDRWSK